LEHGLKKELRGPGWKSRGGALTKLLLIPGGKMNLGERAQKNKMTCRLKIESRDQ